MKKKRKLTWMKAGMLFVFIAFTGECFSQEETGSDPISPSTEMQSKDEDDKDSVKVVEYESYIIEITPIPGKIVHSDYRYDYVDKHEDYAIAFKLNDVYLRLDEDLVFEKDPNKESIEDDIWFQEGNVFYSSEDLSDDLPSCQIDSDNIERRVINSKIHVYATDLEGNVTTEPRLIGTNDPSSVTIARGTIMEVDNMRISSYKYKILSPTGMRVMFVLKRKTEGVDALVLEKFLDIFYGRISYLECIFPYYNYLENVNHVITSDAINEILGTHLSLIGLEI
ncbi:MAG: hypothetical protein OXB84_01750 [Halobacteriovoraceae bacterium]|nr:hypothetical protein [Halobacteriovoraceae bacterium]